MVGGSNPSFPNGEVAQLVEHLKMRLDNIMKNINKIKGIKKQPVVQVTMPSSFLGAMMKNTSFGETANGAVTYTRSGSALLDFYAQAGAMRNSPDEALSLFQKAFASDRLNAIKVLFYLRDVRGGQGERTLFRTCLEWLGTDFPEVFEKIVALVPEYGRWDDLFFDNAKCFELIDEQLARDNAAKNPSLLAKWLPTINGSSQKTVAKAKFFADKLGLSHIEYRKHLRDLRKKINTVEAQMSGKEWGGINYSAVPSQASRIYRNAFKKHDETRYSEFTTKAEKGEVKINAGTLYPYQIYKDATRDYSQALEALWNQLPDYTQGKNALVVADVSGSMSGDPLSVSVSLALYFAERNKGQFKDHFITFSARPTLQRVEGKTLREKMLSIQNAHWDMNTDLQAVFNLILTSAVNNSVAQEEMPETIYIISDMEFDGACSNNTSFALIQKKYEANGYKIPNIVFWNVDARQSNLPAQKNQEGVALVSGFSPVIFKIAVENKNPEQIMFDTINSERYSKIII